MDLHQKAIQLALLGNWKEAITINLNILKSDPKNIDALNRLGRAYQELGQKTNATNCYQKVLKIDKFNPIANRNISLVKTAKAARNTDAPHLQNSSLTMFLEEPGLTKNVTLTRLGDPKSISGLHPGDEVKIVSRQHTVCAITNHGVYVGRLPDDLSSRLRTLLSVGNKYLAWVRTIDSKKISIFIKETYRASAYKNTPSFPLTEKLTYAAFTPPELVHEEKPDVSATEDQEDKHSSALSDQELEEIRN